MSNEQSITVPANAAGYQPIVARVDITIRPGVLGDLPFIDRLQKRHSRELGFLPTAALKGKIKLGQVLVAEAGGTRDWGLGTGEAAASSSLPPVPSPQYPVPLPIAYLIAADRYQKRDEIGYVTQINVVPEYRRSLVAAQLLQAQFDRSAYGCRLYSCWCAQDLKANEFWEAMGFTAIAFRTGSMMRGSRRKTEGGGQESGASTSALHTAFCPPPTRARVHIFWQKRIRANDTTTPWWYPSQTGGGVIREDRLVFPILPGVHWREVGPILLPENDETKFLTATPGDTPEAACVETIAGPAKVRKPRSKKKETAPPVPVTTTVLVSPTPLGGFWFPEQGVAKEVPLPSDELPAEAVVEKPKRAKVVREKTKIDPRLTAMSRELRDRWGERNEAIPALPAKYEVCRRMESSFEPAWRTGPKVIEASPMRALPNAA